MKDDRWHIRAILDYCDSISSDLSLIGDDLESFMSDRTIQRSCSFSLIQIGEYARRVSDDTRRKYPVVHWTEIISMRNVITHNYAHLDLHQMWYTMTVEVPELREKLTGILKQMDTEFASDVKTL